MKKLKECPCCGSRTVSHVNFGAARHTVMCDTCELSTGYMLNDDEAEEAWNSRPKEDGLRKELELMVTCLKDSLMLMEEHGNKIIMSHASRLSNSYTALFNYQHNKKL